MAGSCLSPDVGRKIEWTGRERIVKAKLLIFWEIKCLCRIVCRSAMQKELNEDSIGKIPSY